jgi:hypothetical protein
MTRKAHTVCNWYKNLETEEGILSVIHRREQVLTVYSLFIFDTLHFGAWGGVVVKALHYWSDGPGIDFRWCNWIFQ